VGFGDIVTRNNDERLFTIGLEFMGSFVFAIIISTLTAGKDSMHLVLCCVCVGS
jgi:hypothetical protein